MAETVQARDSHGQVIPALTPGDSQNVATSAVSAQSTAITADIAVVRLFGTEDMYIEFGSNPTALTNGTSMYLPAGVPEYFAVPRTLKAAGTCKIAAIQVSTGGVLNITELN